MEQPKDLMRSKLVERFVTSTGQLVVVHDVADCRGPCPIHRPSDHHMRDWPLVWRDDRHEAGMSAVILEALTGETDELALLDQYRIARQLADNMGLHGWMERVCPHGVGHPDPDSMRYSREFHEDIEPGGSVHSCDGCCHPPEAPGETADD